MTLDELIDRLCNLRETLPGDSVVFMADENLAQLVKPDTVLAVYEPSEFTTSITNIRQRMELADDQTAILIC